MKKRAIESTALLVIVAVAIIAIGYRVAQVQNEILSQYKFSVSPMPQLTSTTLKFTIHFDKLPKDGAKFVSVTCENFISSSWSGTTFYTGDSITIIIQHNGEIKTMPKEAQLWQTEIGFIIPLSASSI